jgi:hypothetical protein
MVVKILGANTKKGYKLEFVTLSRAFPVLRSCFGKSFGVSRVVSAENLHNLWFPEKKITRVV